MIFFGIIAINACYLPRFGGSFSSRSLFFKTQNPGSESSKWKVESLWFKSCGWNPKKGVTKMQIIESLLFLPFPAKKAAFFVSINKFAWISSMHPLILRDPGIQGSIRCQIHQHHIGKLIQPTQGLVDWRTTKPATLAVTLGHKRNHKSYTSNTPWK